MAQTSRRRFGLLAKLTFAVLGGFAFLLLGLVAVAVFALRESTPGQVMSFGRLQVGYGRAAVLAGSGGGDPTAGAVAALRAQMATTRPDLALRVFKEGVPLGDDLPVDAIDREALAAVRAGLSTDHIVEDPTIPGGGYRVFAPLRGDPGVAISVRFPHSVMLVAAEELAIRATIQLSTVMLLICGGLYLVLRRTTRRLTRLSRTVADMAATGDFTQELPRDRGQDELGDLNQGVGALVGLLRTTAGTLQETSAKLAQAARELTETAGQQSELLRQHSQAVGEAAVSAEEIRRTSETAAQRAEEVLEAAVKAGELSEVGESAVRHSLESLGEIRFQVAEMEERIAVVSERAHQISGITQSVKDIADSSNMLALNAAIEAVRSGEQGKGFALVAREMRSLADQSIKATERVREILEDVTIAIQQATAISSRGTQRIETGLGQLSQSGESVRALARMVSESSQSARVIAAAVRQQNVGIVQIVRALADQRALAERTSQGLTLTQAHAEALQSLTRQVSELLRSYRI